jgi:hypothetical protein
MVAGDLADLARDWMAPIWPLACIIIPAGGQPL